MPKYTVNDEEFELIPEDDYEAEFSAITAKTSYVKNEDDEEEARRYYSWEFTIKNDEEYSGRKVFVNVSDKFGPKSKQRKFVEKMIGRKLESGEEFEINDLLGGLYKIEVEHQHNKTLDKTFANVAAVKQLKKRRNSSTADKSSKESPARDLKAKQHAAEEAAAAKSDEEISAEADAVIKTG